VQVDVASVLAGERRTPELLAQAGALAAAAVTDPWADVLAPAAYRAAVAGPVARRAIEAAWEGTWS
jgi:hypothetical protein